jgi:hypothetical protein
MAGEIKKVQFAEGTNVTTPSDVPFGPDDFSGIMPTAKGGTGVNGSATFPTSGTVATTADITAAFEGKSFKEPVVIASDADLTLSGEQTIDGVLTSATRILVKDQSTQSENGIYVTGAGSWTRAADANSWAELVSAIVAVERGTAQADTVWLCLANTGGTLGVDPIVFEKRSGAGAVDLTSDVSGTLPIGNGGTGQTTATSAFDALSPTSAKGDLVAHNGTSSVALAVGTNGKVLAANSAEATGLEWVTAATLPIDLASQVTGTLPIANGGTGQITGVAAIKSLSGINAKGDIITHDVTTTAVLSLGTNGQVLTADNTTALGIKWGSSATVPAAGSVYSDGSALQTTGSFASQANKLVGVNSGATATEYKTITSGTSGTDFAVAHSAGTVTLNLPDASASNRGAVTTADQTFAGLKTFTDGVAGPSAKLLISGAFYNGTYIAAGNIASGTYTANCASYSFFHATATGNFTLDVSNVGLGQVAYVSVAASGADRTITMSRSNAYAQGVGSNTVVIVNGTRCLFQITNTGAGFPMITFVNNIG